MANFRTRVDDLTAFSTTDDVALADWLAEGCKAIIDECLIKPQLQVKL